MQIRLVLQNLDIALAKRPNNCIGNINHWPFVVSIRAKIPPVISTRFTASQLLGQH